MLLPAIQEMPDSQDGVVDHHTRAGEAHHLADLFAFFLLIAMHRAFCAGRFIVPEGAFIDALRGVFF